MVNASDVAASKYETPLSLPRTRTKHTLPYSKYASEIFRHLAFHRVAFVEDFPRFMPQPFKTKRSAHKHLDSIAVEGHIDVMGFSHKSHPHVLVINDNGFDAYEKMSEEKIDDVPAKYVQPNGDNVLHEALITEFASRREYFLRTNAGYKLFFKARHNLGNISGFEDFIPDYVDAWSSPNGSMVDICEILTGQRSITSVKKKLVAAEAWWRSPESKKFLATVLKAGGGDTNVKACRMLVVAHNRNMVGTDSAWERQIIGTTFDLHPDFQRRIWTTTNEKIRTAQSIDDPIWTCGATLVKHRPAWKELSKRKRFGFVTEAIQDEGRFSLFSIGG